MQQDYWTGVQGKQWGVRKGVLSNSAQSGQLLSKRTTVLLPKQPINKMKVSFTTHCTTQAWVLAYLGLKMPYSKWDYEWWVCSLPAIYVYWTNCDTTGYKAGRTIHECSPHVCIQDLSRSFSFSPTVQKKHAISNDLKPRIKYKSPVTHLQPQCWERLQQNPCDIFWV